MTKTDVCIVSKSFTHLLRTLQVTLSKEKKIPRNMPLEIGDEIPRMFP
jgi:hypothetical protein